MTNKKRILYLCTGNSCRSQVAMAWTNKLKGDLFKAYSAGIEPKSVDLRAVKATAEAGVDISVQKSKDIVSLKDIEFDYAVTLCDTARKSCPFFPVRTMVLHRSFDALQRSQRIQMMRRKPCSITPRCEIKSGGLLRSSLNSWRKMTRYTYESLAEPKD
jgi:arsenate reductase (thioredoxin)